MTQTLERWRCDTCGTEYISDVGFCGQRQPSCDGTVWLTSRKTLTQIGDELQSAASRLAEWVGQNFGDVPYEVGMASLEARSAVEEWTELRSSARYHQTEEERTR
jgi:hypothetical protein